MISRALMSGMISAAPASWTSRCCPRRCRDNWARHNHVSEVHVQTSPVDPRSADIASSTTTGWSSTSEMSGASKASSSARISGACRITRWVASCAGTAVREVRRGHDRQARPGGLARRGFQGADRLQQRGRGDGAAKVLQEMNCTVIRSTRLPPRSSSSRTTAPSRPPDRDGSDRVKAVKAKMGVFIDTPGERCFLVDETGTVARPRHRVRRPDAARPLEAHRHGARAGVGIAGFLDDRGAAEEPVCTGQDHPRRGAPRRATRRHGVGVGRCRRLCWPDFAVSFDAIFTTVRVLELLAQTARPWAHCEPHTHRVRTGRRRVLPSGRMASNDTAKSGQQCRRHRPTPTPCRRVARRGAPRRG